MSKEKIIEMLRSKAQYIQAGKAGVSHAVLTIEQWDDLVEAISQAIPYVDPLHWHGPDLHPLFRFVNK